MALAISSPQAARMSGPEMPNISATGIMFRTQ